MPRLCALLAFAAVVSEAAQGGNGEKRRPLDPELLVRANALAERLVTCSFAPLLGAFVGEGLWQSGNTIETLARLAALQSAPPRWAHVFNDSLRQPVIVDQCNDDHQWWGLAWVRAYEATAQFEFLQRAAAVFDHIAASGWTASPCSGGVVWCPAPAGQGYKNAITSELFLSLAMDLHPYAAQLGRASTFFSSWAQRVWTWLEASGMRNSAGLFNDGLNVGADGACFNNNQTEWTYNQGVLVDALGKLGAATGNATLARVAESIVAATMALLSPNGILSEPCSSCDGDQHLFKGIWVRHAAALAAVDAAFAPTVHSFVLANARSLIANAACPGGGFGFSWSSACAIEDTATSSAALDLLVAAAEGGSAPEGAPWLPLGLGNCVDAVGSSMGNCYRNGVDEVACRTSADGDARAVAWDHESTCLGDGFCRVRTLAGAASCAAGWAWADGPATAVSSANGAALTTCYVRGTAV